MPLPVPETFVRRRQVRGQVLRSSLETSAAMIPSEASNLYSMGHPSRVNLSSNRDVGGIVRSATRILSNSERLSLEDLEWILTIQDDFTLENTDGAVRQQILGNLLLPGAERPEHDLLVIPDMNERDKIEYIDHSPRQ